MTIKEQIDADVKTAMLAGDKTLVTTLRGLKAVILNEEVSQGSRDTGLSDEDIVRLLQKESKKRQESADLFAQGGNIEKSQAELAEKAVIAKYLPEQLSEEALAQIIDEIITTTGAAGMQAMGQVIGAVKSRTGAAADSALIARLVKERLPKADSQDK